jgi:hypothetical protein
MFTAKEQTREQTENKTRLERGILYASVALGLVSAAYIIKNYQAIPWLIYNVRDIAGI